MRREVKANPTRSSPCEPFVPGGSAMVVTLVVWWAGWSALARAEQTIVAPKAQVQGKLTDAEVCLKTGLKLDEVRLLQFRKGMNNESIASIPTKRLQSTLMRLARPDLPRQRAAFRVLQEAGLKSKIDPSALTKALEELSVLRSQLPVGVKSLAGVPTGRVALARSMVRPVAGLHPGGSGWFSLGPGNVGGRTRSILVHPDLPDTFWLGSIAGGIWRTDDGGTSYFPVDDFMANLAVTSIVMDPSNHAILYAGTGEGFSNIDALPGAGIFRSTNGGNKFLPLAVTQNDPRFQFINRLAISPDGKTLIAATTEGLFRSDDAAHAVWATSLAMPAGVADVEFHPTDNLQAVAGGLADGKVYQSTDGGKTWNPGTPTSAWVGRVKVTYAKADPKVVYASVDIHAGELWRSTDSGATYTQRSTGTNYLGDQGWYDNIVWAGDPTKADLVIVGGVDLYRSTDGDTTLIDISTWWSPRSAHADHHAIVAHSKYDGSMNKKVYFGNDGGIYSTDDVTTVGNDASQPRDSGWVNLNSNYAVTQFYSAAGNVGSGTIIGGAQDNGTIRYTTSGGAQGWTTMFGGDGGYCASDPTDANVFYGEYVYLDIVRSLDGGATAEPISGEYSDAATGQWQWKPVPYRIPDAFSQNANFIAPFVLDPNAPARILAGGLSLWRTNDAKTPNTTSTGPSWQMVKTSAGSPISSIAIANGNSDMAWVGYDSGQIYTSSNATKDLPILTWKLVSNSIAPALPTNRLSTRIVIDPTNSKIVYLLFGGYATDNVWKTTDGGKTWAVISSALPAAPARGLAIHPTRPTFLYLGTEVGVFASENGGATWSPTNEGPTNCSVDDVIFLRNTLIAVTHGRGLFQISLP